MGSERTSDLRLLGVQKNKQKKKCDCLTRSLALVFVFLNSFLLPWPALPGSPHPLGPDPCWLPAGTAPCSASSSARLRAEARRGSLGRHNRKHNLPVGRLHPMIDFWAKKYFGFFFPTNQRCLQRTLCSLAWKVLYLPSRTMCLLLFRIFVACIFC